ncbi:MAG: nucleotidyltransferase family protein [Leptospirales bacterium]
MPLQKEDIITKLMQNSSTIKSYGIKKIGLFGSYVKRSHNPKSDIDILIEFEEGHKSYDNFYELFEFLEHLFSKKIDLLTIESLSPYIGPDILKEVEYIEIAA